MEKNPTPACRFLCCLSCRRASSTHPAQACFSTPHSNFPLNKQFSTHSLPSPPTPTLTQRNLFLLPLTSLPKLYLSVTGCLCTWLSLKLPPFPPANILYNDLSHAENFKGSILINSAQEHEINSEMLLCSCGKTALAYINVHRYISAYVLVS